MNWSAWIAPDVIVPALGVVVASVIVPLLLHALKGRRERAVKFLEIRTNAYLEYFRRYEVAARRVSVDYEEFSKITLRNAFRDLLEQEASPESIIKFQDEVSKFPHQIQEAHRKTTEEVTTLKILGSKELLHLTERFEALSKDLLEMSSAWLGEMKEALASPDFEAPIAIEMKRKGEEISMLKEKIIMQMREEIGLD